MKRMTNRIVGGYELSVRLPEQFNEGARTAIASEKQTGQKAGSFECPASPSKKKERTAKEKPFQQRLVDLRWMACAHIGDTVAGLRCSTRKHNTPGEVCRTSPQLVVYEIG